MDYYGGMVTSTQATNEALFDERRLARGDRKDLRNAHKPPLPVFSAHLSPPVHSAEKRLDCVVGLRRDVTFSSEERPALWPQKALRVTLEIGDRDFHSSLSGISRGWFCDGDRDRDCSRGLIWRRGIGSRILRLPQARTILLVSVAARPPWLAPSARRVSCGETLPHFMCHHPFLFLIPSRALGGNTGRHKRGGPKQAMLTHTVTWAPFDMSGSGLMP